MGKVHRNSLQPGYRLHWYEIRKVLGQGGFGITYLAHDTNLDKDVAIKEYLPMELAVREGDFSVHPLTEDRGRQYQWGLERFVAEARTLSRFEHPNIVRVHAVFEENNTGYMVMSYEEGQSLQEMLSGRRTLEESALLKILIPVLGGLELVHQAGFIHRDIKPDNIFIRKDGSPVLLDFGSARQALGEQTKTLTSLVSPGYAPFEQYYSRSDEQGPWTDIYGLGATLYRAIAGVAPLDAVDRSKSIVEGHKDIFVPATEIGKGKYSHRFLTAIDHALKFKRRDRPQSIREWQQEFGAADDLAEIQRIKKLENQRTRPGTRAHVQQRKGHRLLPVILLVLLGTVAAIYYQWDEISLLLAGNRQEQPPEMKMVGQQGAQPAVLDQPPPEETLIKERQQEITQLMDQAEAAFNAGNYLDPPGGNALELYLRVLEVAPDNPMAVAGKQKIFHHFLNQARTLSSENKLDEAERAILKADIIAPDSREVKLMRLTIDEKRAEAQKLALDTERKRQQEESKRLEEEQRLAEQRRIEQAKMAELEKQKQEEAEQEQQYLAEERRKAEEARLAQLEQQRKEEEARTKAEQEQLRLAEEDRKAEQARAKAEREKKEQYDLLITEAGQALNNKDYELAGNKYNQALALYKDDSKASEGLRLIEDLNKVCKGVIGLWDWFHGGTTRFHADGTMDGSFLIFSDTGTWECMDPEARRFILRWKNGGWIDELVLSEDGGKLEGKNQFGAGVSGTKSKNQPP